MKQAAMSDDSVLAKVKSLLDGGVLKFYSVARPSSPLAPITRSGLLATFRFALPAFSAVAPAELSGAFSVGPGNTEITLSEVSTTPGYPISLTRFRLGNGTS
jgi:hypothetical protein